ncbi:MAG: hypothetical protein KDD69_19595, partial [Bdellovibrionales bacterium]|nr:hypothetical protein [Bdellovibrionales bacterium]
SDEPLTECAKCGQSGSARRLLSASAFHLKGSGWYKTDYSSSNGGSKSSGTNGASDSGSAPDSGSSTSEGSESKASSTASGATATTTEKKGATSSEG